MALRVDGRTARAPDAAAAAMRHRHGGKRAGDLRGHGVDRDEPAGLGFAERGVQARAVGAQVQRAALHAKIVAPRRRDRRRPGIAVDRVEARLVQAHGPAVDDLAAAEVERVGLPAVLRVAVSDVYPLPRDIDDRRGEHAGGNGIERRRLQPARRCQPRAPQDAAGNDVAGLGRVDRIDVAVVARGEHGRERFSAMLAVGDADAIEVERRCVQARRQAVDAVELRRLPQQAERIAGDARGRQRRQTRMPAAALAVGVERRHVGGCRSRRHFARGGRRLWNVDFFQSNAVARNANAGGPEDRIDQRLAQHRLVERGEVVPAAVAERTAALRSLVGPGDGARFGPVVDDAGAVAVLRMQRGAQDGRHAVLGESQRGIELVAIREIDDAATDRMRCVDGQRGRFGRAVEQAAALGAERRQEVDGRILRHGRCLMQRDHSDTAAHQRFELLAMRRVGQGMLVEAVEIENDRGGIVECGGLCGPTVIESDDLRAPAFRRGFEQGFERIDAGGVLVAAGGFAVRTADEHDLRAGVVGAAGQERGQQDPGAP